MISKECVGVLFVSSDHSVVTYTAPSLSISIQDTMKKTPTAISHWSLPIAQTLQAITSPTRMGCITETPMVKRSYYAPVTSHGEHLAEASTCISMLGPPSLKSLRHFRKVPPAFQRCNSTLHSASINVDGVMLIGLLWKMWSTTMRNLASHSKVYGRIGRRCFG